MTVFHTSSKLNLNLFLTSRSHTVILTYLCFSSSDLVHSSFCPLYFRKEPFHRLFSEQKRCGFWTLSVIQTWWKSTNALLGLLETVRCIDAQFSPLCPVQWYYSLLVFLTTPFVPDCDCPESSSPVNSTKIARVSTWARHCASCWRHMTCYLSAKNKWGIHMLAPWCPPPSYTSGQCHCLR